jgi:hypothetical protein
MDMDLVVIFGFVATIVFIITAGIVLFPIGRKLGFFLEQAARDRVERRFPSAEDAPQLTPGGYEELIHALGSLETRVEQIAERQAFAEQLMGSRTQSSIPDPSRDEE